MSGSFERQQQYWLSLADQYLNVATLGLANTSGSAAPVIVHLAWQASENYLKALGVQHNTIITHDLGQVMNHLVNSNALSSHDISQLSSDTAIVTGSSTYNATRYPENDPTYWSSLPTAKINDVVHAAERIRDFTRAKISSKATTR